MAEAIWTATAPGVNVRRVETPPIAVLRVRGATDRVLDAIGGALAVDLPREPNRANHAAVGAVWLAPGEWMIVGDGVDRDRVLAATDGAAAAHLADVGDGRVLYVVEGYRARTLLAKGCTLDLHPRTFGSGRCAQSALAQILVLIEQRSADACFHVYADASHARHLDLWFDDALIEFRHQDRTTCG